MSLNKYFLLSFSKLSWVSISTSCWVSLRVSFSSRNTSYVCGVQGANELQPHFGFGVSLRRSNLYFISNKLFIKGTVLFFKINQFFKQNYKFLGKRYQVVKKMSNVKKSNISTMEEVHRKNKFTQWCSHILMSIFTSSMKVTKTGQKYFLWIFWGFLITNIFDDKIYINMCEPHYVNLFFCEPPP